MYIKKKMITSCGVNNDVTFHFRKHIRPKYKQEYLGFDLKLILCLIN